MVSVGNYFINGIVRCAWSAWQSVSFVKCVTKCKLCDISFVLCWICVMKYHWSEMPWFVRFAPTDLMSWWITVIHFSLTYDVLVMMLSPKCHIFLFELVFPYTGSLLETCSLLNPVILGHRSLEKAFFNFIYIYIAILSFISSNYYDYWFAQQTKW